MCGYRGRFRAAGIPPRMDARCPVCSSLERHRALALFLRKHPNLCEGDVINFAPDLSIERLIKPKARRYRSADLFRPGCDMKLDLEALDLADASVDLFVLIHLLEHVDDKKALAELHRCLTPGGAVIIMVPLDDSSMETYENEHARNGGDQMRDLHFGQIDHIRYYGADIRDRIRTAGFRVEDYHPAPSDSVRYGLGHNQTVFLATKPT